MFYVYDLIDPRDGSVFYVGKGTGDRHREHVRDAKNGASGPKCDRIRDILSAGLTVEWKIVREFDDELAAYAYEKRRISRIGLQNLTNIAPGGGAVREPKELPPVSQEQVVAMFRRIAAKPEPKHGLWARAIHRAVVRRVHSIENRA